MATGNVPVGSTAGVLHLLADLRDFGAHCVERKLGAYYGREMLYEEWSLALAQFLVDRYRARLYTREEVLPMLAEAFELGRKHGDEPMRKDGVTAIIDRATGGGRG